jgi:hypothetical protein
MWGLLAPLVVSELPDLRDRRAIRVRQARAGHRVCRVMLALRVRQEPLRLFLARPGRREALVPRGRKVFKAMLVPREPPARRAWSVRLARKVFRVCRAMLARRAQPGLWGLPGLWVRRVRVVLPVLLVRLVQLELLVPRDQLLLRPVAR